MKNLKSFNEAKEGSQPYLWCVIISEVGGWPDESSCKCFTKKMMAADYYIKNVNEACETEFERYYDDDGSRTFFTKVEENEDLEMAEEHISQNNDTIDIQMLELDIISSLAQYKNILK